MRLFSVPAELAHAAWLRLQARQLRREYERYRRRAGANGHTALEYGVWRRNTKGAGAADNRPGRKVG